jgi:hypothetical protein
MIIRLDFLSDEKSMYTKGCYKIVFIDPLKYNPQKEFLSTFGVVLGSKQNAL